MRPTTLKATLWFIAFLCFGITTSAFAQRARYVEERSYIGGFGLYTTLSNDKESGFNGLTSYYLIGYSEENILPKIKMNYGFGGLLGYRRGDYAVEVSYWRSEHKAEYDALWLGTTIYQDTAIYQSINMDLKRFILTYLPVQPYFSLGMCFPWLVVHNGSSLAPGVIGDVSYSGMGFNLGLGVEVFAMPNLTVVGGAVKRWSEFSYAKGASGHHSDILNPTGDNKVGIRDNSIGFYMGITVDFI